MQNSKIKLATIAIAIAMFGCGEPERPGASAATEGAEVPAEAPVSRASKTGSGTVSAMIGAAGGRLELTEGPRVVVPAGAVDEAQDFVLKTAPLTTAFGNLENERPAGPTFVFSPGVEANGEPIEVSIDMPSIPDGWGEPALAYEYAVGNRVGAEDSQFTKWQYETAQLQGGRAVAKLDALPGMRLQFVITNLNAQ